MKRQKDCKKPTSSKSNHLEPQRMHSIFKMQHRLFNFAYHVNKSQYANEEQFVKIMMKTDEMMKKENARRLFKKIDADGRGKIDWSSYTTYILNEDKMHAKLRSDRQIVGFDAFEIRRIKTNHLDSIIRIIQLKEYNLMRSSGREVIADGFATVSAEGCLSIWDTDWKLKEQTSIIHKKSLSCYYLDACFMSDCNVLVVTSADMKIIFYNLSEKPAAKKKFEISHLRNCPSCIDYMVSKDHKSSLLTWGDMQGSIYIIKFFGSPNHSLFAPNKLISGEIPLPYLQKNNIKNMSLKFFSKVFNAMTGKIKFFHDDKDNDIFIACSLSTSSGLLLGEVGTNKPDEKSKEVHINKLSVFGRARRSLCLDYDALINSIATGHSDCNIRLWNSHVTSRPTTVLFGHANPVSMVMLKGENYQVISVSIDFEVRLWNLIDSSCTQSLKCKFTRRPISAIHFDSNNHHLVIASCFIALIKQLKATSSDGMTSHNGPISSVIYNAEFDQVITAGEDACVFVWRLSDGKKISRMEEVSEVTAAAFDTSSRRLVTGTRKGDVTIWNVNNGSVISRLPPKGCWEVSSVTTGREAVICGGWNQQITAYLCDGDDVTTRVFDTSHKDDISSLDFHHNSGLLASASMDGHLIVWNFSKCDVTARFRLNPVMSHEPEVGGSNRRSKSHDQIKRNSFVPDISWMVSSEKKFTLQKENDDVIDRSILKIVFLQNRKCSDPCASLLTATGSGNIGAWAMGLLGGLTGLFCAVDETCDGKAAVTSLDCFDNFTVLATGDSYGWVSFWDIRKYCDEDSVEEQRRICEDACLRQKSLYTDSPERKSFNLKKYDPRWYKPIPTPPLLTLRVRCHKSPIISVAMVKKSRVFITGSREFDVKLWSMKGNYLATFGVDVWSGINELISKAENSAIKPKKTSLPYLQKLFNDCEKKKLLVDKKVEKTLDNLDIKQSSEFKHFVKNIHLKSNKKFQVEKIKLKGKHTVYGKLSIAALEETYPLTLPYYLKTDKLGSTKTYKPKIIIMERTKGTDASISSITSNS